MISYEQFKQIELRAARVVAAERVVGSEKLLKLQVTLGEAGERQIIAGIGRSYEPESLVGKTIVIVANLEPRQLMGLESQGMVVAAHGAAGEAVLLLPEREVPPGSDIS